MSTKDKNWPASASMDSFVLTVCVGVDPSRPAPEQGFRGQFAKLAPVVLGEVPEISEAASPADLRHSRFGLRVGEHVKGMNKLDALEKIQRRDPERTEIFLQAADAEFVFPCDLGENKRFVPMGLEVLNK